jgi:hypothetical protein
VSALLVMLLVSIALGVVLGVIQAAVEDAPAIREWFTRETARRKVEAAVAAMGLPPPNRCRRKWGRVVEMSHVKDGERLWRATL